MPKRTRLTKEERKDIKEHYRRVLKLLMVRMQNAIDPCYAVERATRQLQLAQECIDSALEMVDRVATDQERFADLRAETLALCMLISQLDNDEIETESDVKKLRNKLRNGVRNNKAWG